jgi:hypothetical protein
LQRRRRDKAEGSGEETWQRFGQSCCDVSQSNEKSVSLEMDQPTGSCQWE